MKGWRFKGTVSDTVREREKEESLAHTIITKKRCRIMAKKINLANCKLISLQIESCQWLLLPHFGLILIQILYITHPVRYVGGGFHSMACFWPGQVDNAHGQNTNYAFVSINESEKLWHRKLWQQLVVEMVVVVPASGVALANDFPHSTHLAIIWFVLCYITATTPSPQKTSRCSGITVTS